MRTGSITLKQAALWCGGSVAPEYEALQFSGANFDTRRLQPGELFVAILGARDGHDYAARAMELGAAAVLASRPVEAPAIYVEDTLTAMQAIARGYRETLTARCVGITGSVGKTTTKEMIAAVLGTSLRTEKTAENFNNGMGLPVTVLGVGPDCEAMVLEMGMNHFGEISLLTSIARPEIAVITNVGTMHIENLGSREGILQAKLEILEGLRPGGLAVLNGDNDLLRQVRPDCRTVFFGFGSNCQVRAEQVQATEDGQRFTALVHGEPVAVELPVAGEHHVLDALAALAVGAELGIPGPVMAEGLKHFRNTGMRQKIWSRDGVTVIEDCYNAGPESMAAALQVLGSRAGRRIAVLGGMLELGDYAPGAHYDVGQAAAQNAELLFCYGDCTEHCVSGAKAAGMTYAQKFESHEALAAALRETLRPGDVLLVKGSRGMRMERVLQILFP